MPRCAIYTRKSTEDGLEQDFNSLHAQREACEAFIKSQRQEGWSLIRTTFDDGGYSGGTMDRPALQQLLEAIKRHEVDIIVVYKVDRLTRSLSDFSKIVERFDSHDVSFISVTQQFNTTTSMGRLTLNMLLSFAQFEREVTAERIRDKIAASKKKGMWMGGPPPLGYDVKDRKLVINKTEATTVRRIFDLYEELGTVRKLKNEMDKLGIITKRRVQKNGIKIGGKPFFRGNLYQLLSNPLYIGRVPHKGQSYPGQHKAIIDDVKWGTVQEILKNNAVNRSCPANTKAPFLLTGLAFDEAGDLLYQSQAHKKGKRYCYYISKRLRNDAPNNDDGWRLPAKTLEPVIITAIQNLLRDQVKLMDLLCLGEHTSKYMKILKEESDAVVAQLTDASPKIQRHFLQTIIQRIDLEPGSVVITIRLNGLVKALKISGSLITEDNRDNEIITVPISLRRRGVEAKLVITGPDREQCQPDSRLCRLIAQARYWFDQLASGKATSVRAIALQENIFETEVSRILPLAFLAPKIIEKILIGQKPEDLTVKKLKRLGSLPSDWDSQKKLLRINL